MDSDDLIALEKSVKECIDRCLHSAAQWAAELHASAPYSYSNNAPFAASTPARAHRTRLSFSFTLDPMEAQSQLEDQTLEEAEQEQLVIARTYFNSKQLDRAAFVLQRCRSSKALFLRAYSRFLVFQRRNLRAASLRESQSSVPPVLEEILYDIAASPPDPFIMRGAIFRELGRRAEATASLLQCLNSNPWIWSAWSELSQCLEDSEEFAGLQMLLPQHPMSRLFAIRVMIEFHSPSEEDIRTINDLLYLFPNSLYLLSQKALIYYHRKDWTLAEQIYDSILRTDPHKIDDMDIYSNILYVSEKRTKLSKLAHDFLALDKDRPEVCCIVGNHYALRGEHEKAVKYFQRAVQLDRSCLSAWTLMGHEYVEMKSSEAAIEAYRRAVDLNRRDYRAWFGLGQAYELLSMHQYALHYYQRASALRPYDVRVWQAIAMCYSDLSRPREAIECFKRAQISADPYDTVLTLKIAALYDILGDYSSASSCHRQAVDLNIREGKSVAEYAKSCIYLARYHMSRAALLTKVDKLSSTMSKGLQLHVESAREYLQMVADSNAEEVALANDLLRKLHKLGMKS